jgi:autotransporter-associated beta strand protein
LTVLDAGTVNLGLAEQSGTSGPLGANNHRESIVLNGGYLQYSAVNQFDYSLRFSTDDNQQYNVDTNGQTVTWASALTSSTGCLNKVGLGTLILSGHNTYDGTTTVYGGILDLANANAVGGSTVIVSGGSLVFDSSVIPHAFTFGGLSGNSNIVLQDNAATPDAVSLTVGENGANTTYSGILSGIGSLTKSGTGTLNLTGASTYTGVTTLNSGTVTLGAAEISGTSGPIGRQQPGIHCPQRRLVAVFGGESV